MQVLNIAAYRFTHFSPEELELLCAQIESAAQKHGLLGTTLLATEGINLFMAGTEARVRAFWGEFEALDARLCGMRVKESLSDNVPFKKLRVRVRREIITSGRADLGPTTSETAPHLAPETLAAWLDEGRPLTLLDTRNAFEVRFGTFESAQHLEIANFGAFEREAGAQLADVKDVPLVMFCTGGIRCEKAAPMLMEQGFSEVYQLEDGILGYFERVGGRHWRGDCFVFDGRIALDPELAPSGVLQCPECHDPVEASKQACVCGYAVGSSTSS